MLGMLQHISIIMMLPCLARTDVIIMSMVIMIILIIAVAIVIGVGNDAACYWRARNGSALTQFAGIDLMLINTDNLTKSEYI